MIFQSYPRLTEGIGSHHWKKCFLFDVVGIHDICIYLSFIVWLYITYVFIQDWGAITSSIIAFLVWCFEMMPWWLWHIQICPNFLCNLYCMFFLARNTMICWYILLFGTSTHFHICHKSSGKLQVVLFETTLWEDVVPWLECSVRERWVFGQSFYFLTNYDMHEMHGCILRNSSLDGFFGQNTSHLTDLTPRKLSFQSFVE